MPHSLLFIIIIRRRTAYFLARVETENTANEAAAQKMQKSSADWMPLRSMSRPPISPPNAAPSPLPAT